MRGLSRHKDYHRTRFTWTFTRRHVRFARRGGRRRRRRAYDLRRSTPPESGLVAPHVVARETVVEGLESRGRRRTFVIVRNARVRASAKNEKTSRRLRVNGVPVGRFLRIRN